MRDPYRVAVWGPGGVGSACIRDLALLPETELVGVFAYSEHKEGLDAGECVGIDPLGVRITRDRAEFMAVEADVVLFCPRDFGMFESEGDVLALLAAGFNVITMIPYSSPRHRGFDVEKRYLEACETGNSTFHVAGVDPNFASERLVPLVTAMSNHITHIRLQEGAVIAGQFAGANEAFFNLAGYGIEVDAYDDFPLRTELPSHYFVPSMRDVAERLGRPLDHIEHVNKALITDRDITLPTATIPAGTVGAMGHEWVGYHEGEAFISFEGCWPLTTELMADWMGGKTNVWVVTVEGRPSTRVTVDVAASIERGLDRWPEDPTSPAWYFTSVAMLQSIPVVVDAPAGLFATPMPYVHWKPDMRL